MIAKKSEITVIFEKFNRVCTWAKLAQVRLVVIFASGRLEVKKNSSICFQFILIKPAGTFSTRHDGS